MHGWRTGACANSSCCCLLCPRHQFNSLESILQDCGMSKALRHLYAYQISHKQLLSMVSYVGWIPGGKNTSREPFHLAADEAFSHPNMSEYERPPFQLQYTPMVSNIWGVWPYLPSIFEVCKNHGSAEAEDVLPPFSDDPGLGLPVCFFRDPIKASEKGLNQQLYVLLSGAAANREQRLHRPGKKGNRVLIRCHRECKPCVFLSSR